MRPTYFHISASALVAIVYGLLRALSTGKPAEALISSLLLALFVFVVLRRKQVAGLGTLGQTLVPAGATALFAALALVVAGMGVLVDGVSITTAALDAMFAFVFFAAFGSLFSGERAANTSNSYEASRVSSLYWRLFNFMVRRVVAGAFCIVGAIVALGNLHILLPGATVVVVGVPTDDLLLRAAAVGLPLVVALLGVALFRAKPFAPGGNGDA